MWEQPPGVSKPRVGGTGIGLGERLAWVCGGHGRPPEDEVAGR